MGFFVPLLVLGLPLYDTLFVVTMRLVKGQSVIKKSEDHFVFQLLKMGYTKNQTVGFMYLLAGVFSACALVVSRTSYRWGVGALILVSIMGIVIALKVALVNINTN
jgi:UDP-GlcNAc:undecaprenyl-phosphate GlcNAc-1-phosphate transferase